MKTRWIEHRDIDNQMVEAMMEALNFDKSEPADRNLAILLVQRGITTYDEAKKFFRPELSFLHNPFLMKDMDKAVERIEKAIANKEKVLVYGDYDVDGTTAVAVVYMYLKRFFNKKRIEFYIPDRYEEGYGISYKGIDYAAKNDFSLVIALDCGIKAVEKIEYANNHHVDFIICDHHRAGDIIPNAVAVLDPKRPDCNYPDKDLSGCGVGFKLVTALCQHNGGTIEEIYESLDLLAVSIAADIVPITGENRVLAHFGLEKLNKEPRPGFLAMLQYANVFPKNEGDDDVNALTRKLTISDLVFKIGPRINAAGRIDKASNAVRLLTTDRPELAFKLASSVNELNDMRREYDNSITEQALAMINADEELRNAHSTVVFNEEWHKGVIGIVASRLTDYYFRPTIVLTRANDIITGSARSIKDFDIYDAIDSCSDLLEHFGGHKYAAGLSLKPENLEVFRRRFEEYVATHITKEELIPDIDIDLNINLCDITPKFVRVLKQFAPFGPGNMAPLFRTDGVVDNGFTRQVGGGKHLKLCVTQPNIGKEGNGDMEVFNAIAFQKGDYYDRIHKGEPFSICYHIEENFWQGRSSLQLNVKDIKFADEI